MPHAAALVVTHYGLPPHQAEAGSVAGASGGGASGPVFSTFAEPQEGAGSDDE